MKGFTGNIERITMENDDFRRVLYTGEHLQLVLMSLKPAEAIGGEVHHDHDQFFRIEEGSGEVHINGAVMAVKNGDAFLVPAHTAHNVMNNGTGPLRLYTLYGPPQHQDGVVFATKKAAEASDEHFDGKLTE